MESVSVDRFPTEEVGVGGMSRGWESRACVSVGDSTVSVREGGAFLATFRIGEEAFRVVRVEKSSSGLGVSCLRFATTSEKVRTGEGGDFHTGEGHAEIDLGGGDLEAKST